MKIHVKIQNNTYEVVIGDIHARPIQARVDGETFEVWPEETVIPSTSQPAPTTEAAVPIKQIQIAPSAQASNGSSVITAPIPGTILDVLVTPGSEVQYGQELCILEAMKMKNSIRSTREGIIEEVLVAKGDQVNHGQLLMRFKD